MKPAERGGPMSLVAWQPFSSLDLVSSLSLSSLSLFPVPIRLIIAFSAAARLEYFSSLFIPSPKTSVASLVRPATRACNSATRGPFT